MEAELRNFQATVNSLCGSGIAQFQSFKSHTILYAGAELRNFKSQYIPFFYGGGTAEIQAKEYSKSNNSLCAEAELQVTQYSVCGISLVSYARIRNARERRAKGPCGKAILAVLFSTVPSWRWPLHGFCLVCSVLIVTRIQTLGNHHGRRPLGQSFLKGQYVEPKARS